MPQHLTVQQLNENPEVAFTGLLGFTSEYATVPEVQYYVGITEGTFGMRADGTTYWTTGLVPPDEQVFLTSENGRYYLSR